MSPHITYSQASSRRFLLLLPALLLVVLTACEKKVIPLIENAAFEETEPTVVVATADISAHEIDACGVCYSEQNMTPTPEKCDALVEGTLDGKQFTATLMLKPHAVYYLVIYATNELGTTTSQPIRLRTSYREARPDDNPFPEL